MWKTEGPWSIGWQRGEGDRLTLSDPWRGAYITLGSSIMIAGDSGFDD